MRRIAVLNLKGGSAKTTTAVNLAACLARRGTGVLLIDADPQASTTAWLGPCDPPYLEHVLEEEVPLAEAVRRSRVDGLSLLPASPRLAQAVRHLAGQPDASHLLAAAVRRAGVLPYDVLLVDCAPELGLLALNALLAVDEVLIPVVMDGMALRGLAQVLDTLALLETRLGHQVRVAGAPPAAGAPRHARRLRQGPRLARGAPRPPGSAGHAERPRRGRRPRPPLPGLRARPPDEARRPCPHPDAPPPLPADRAAPHRTADAPRHRGGLAAAAPSGVLGAHQRLAPGPAEVERRRRPRHAVARPVERRAGPPRHLPELPDTRPPARPRGPEPRRRAALPRPRAERARDRDPRRRAARTVSADPATQRELLFRAYAHVDGAARAFLDHHFTRPENDPRLLAQQVVRTVYVTAVLPVPGSSSWRLQWEEHETPRNFGSPGVSAWEAYLSVRIVPPQNTEVVHNNPLGLYVTEINWTRVVEPPKGQV